MEFQVYRDHLRQTPMMQPQDAVKLAYQSAYGCGHLLPGREICVEMIRKEQQQVTEQDVPVYTFIGNGLCRLNLAAPQVRRLDAEMIWRMMDGTDRVVRARKDVDLRLKGMIGAVTDLAHKGETGFSYQALRTYLDGYDGGVVSHTQAYRDAYQPSYRVVLEDYALLVPVLAEIRQGHRVVVFDGPCGSGKTTLAGRLAELLNCTPIPMDDFFLLPDMRTPERLAQPSGNVHRERFLAEVLTSLPGEVHWQRFDCGTGSMIPRCIPEGAVTVIEGSYSHHPAFADDYKRLQALRIFVEVQADEQLRRIAKRDPEMLSMFQSRWIPLEKNYFEAYDIRGGADLVICSPERSGKA